MSGKDCKLSKQVSDTKPMLSERMRDDFEKAFGPAGRTRIKWPDEVAALEQSLAQTRADLGWYGRHTTDCALSDSMTRVFVCTCGFAAALEGVE